MSHSSHPQPRRVVALDLGDRRTTLARRQVGQVVFEECRTEPSVLRARFESESPSRVVLEAGSQSHWIAWMLEELGHEPVVVHPRRLKMITDSAHKTDRADAEWLLRLGETDLGILRPITLRSRTQQSDLVLLRNRKLLTHMRTMAVQAVRSHAKLFGCGLPSGDAPAFPKRARAGLCSDLKLVCEPLLHHIEQLTVSIREIDAKIRRLCETRHPETAGLRQVPSIGEITALTFVLTLQHPACFQRNRQAGPAIGLVPRKRASGMRDPELRITKLGDTELRRLLVLAAHRTMRVAAPDSDLKRFGLRLAARGGKSAKKRAVVAVARKLAVLLLALWRTGEVYEPLRQSTRSARAA